MKKLQAVEMRMLGLMEGATLLDIVSNEYIRGSMGIRDTGQN